MKNFIKEFKDFINQGNVLEFAVAVVIGTAFTAIVNSVVNDLIMPLISLITGGIDFSEMKFVIGTGPTAAAFTYGNFISALIQFILIALVIFLIVKAANKLRKLTSNAEEETPAPICPHCLEEVKEGATRCPHCTGAIEQTESK